MFIDTALPGCFEVRPFCSQDGRGTLVKTFHAERFAQAGLNLSWQEAFYSRSRQGVLRGMHFQAPPHDHEKLVHCLQGRILDVVLDLRRAQPTYGRHLALVLDVAKGPGLFIPKGMAHGFLALTDDVLVSYKVTSTHAPSHDRGILWNSFGLNWGIESPILSARDQAHPAWCDFDSPFHT